ncbi:MAG: hypothetical protein GY822_24745, partial [Deltaproteobacteria bacterium]|nr:hypothetical protein [Deltaproteobacteria bacterium]
MSIVHCVDKELNLLLSTYEGAITMKDIVSSYMSLYSAGEYMPGMNELVDLLVVHGLRVKVKQVGADPLRRRLS